MNIVICDTSGALYAVWPGRLAAAIRSEGDLLDPYLIARLEPSSCDYGAIQCDPSAPLGLEVINLHSSGCEWCDGAGTYRGPCQFRRDEQGWYAWGPSDEPGAPHGEAMCPECRGTGRRYEWTGVHLTQAQLDAWSDGAHEVVA